MNYLDYIIFIAILIGFILGFKDGLVRKVIGVIGFVLGIFLAFQFSHDVAVYLSPLLNNEIYLAEIVSGFIIFFLTIVLFAVLKRIIHPFDKVNQFVNQLLGGIAGTIQIVYFISAFLLLVNLFGIPSEGSKKESLIYNKVYEVIPITIDLIIGSDEKAQNYIKDFIETKEDTLQHFDENGQDF